MGYINLHGKYWRKLLSAEEREAVQSAFVGATTFTAAEWERLDYRLLEANGYFRRYPRPETGKRDGWRGITRKQIRRYMDAYGTRGLAEALRYIKSPDPRRYLDVDGTIDWKRVWSDKIAQPGYCATKLLKRVKRAAGLTSAAGKRLRSPELVARIETGELDASLVKSRFEKWRELHRRVPDADIVWVSIDPERFDLQDFKKLKELAEAEKGIGFARMSLEQQEEICLLYEKFGAEAVPFVGRHGLSHAVLVMQADIPDARIVKRIVHLLEQGDRAELLDEKRLSMVARFTRRHAGIVTDDVARLLASAKTGRIAAVQRGIAEVDRHIAEEPDTVAALVRNVFKWGDGGSRDIMFSFFHLREQVPADWILRDFGHVAENGWRTEAVKFDTETLFLGIATNCCLHPGHENGARIFSKTTGDDKSVYLYMRDADSELVGHILAWEAEARDGKRTLVLDSIETHRKMVGEGRLARLFRGTIAALYDRYDAVYCGYDGQYSPKDILSFGELVDAETSARLVRESERIGYSDVKDGVILLYDPRRDRAERGKDAA